MVDRDERLTRLEEIVVKLDERMQRWEKAWEVFQHNHFAHLVESVNDLQALVHQLLGGYRTLKWIIPVMLTLLSMSVAIAMLK